ncbi:hypothetical protein TRVA0_019S02234 [Trichomonascus vanleenenianus]|uniref:uncharacterized protein n=1 Tax=Trichomonascus vanleenenianus TaxID=2268995 RepID=UPI003ECB10A0
MDETQPSAQGEIGGASDLSFHDDEDWHQISAILGQFTTSQNRPAKAQNDHPTGSTIHEELFRDVIVEEPRETVFPTKEAALHYCKRRAIENHYRVAIANAKASSVRLRCIYGNDFKKTKAGDKRRQMANVMPKTCPFAVSVKKKDHNWQLVVINGRHDHGPIDFATYRYADPLTERDYEIIRDGLEEGASPRDTLEKIKSDRARLGKPVPPNLLKRIYNYRTKLNRENITGGSDIGLISSLLDRSKFSYEYKVDSSSRSRTVTDLLWYHDLGFEFFKQDKDVLYIDFVVHPRQNSYCLIHVSSVSAHGNLYPIAFAYTKNFTMESFEWHLDTLKTRYLRYCGSAIEPRLVFSAIDTEFKIAASRAFPSAMHLITNSEIRAYVARTCSEVAAPVRNSFSVRVSKLVSAPADGFDKTLAELKYDVLNSPDYMPFPQILEAFNMLESLKSHFGSPWVSKFRHFGLGSIPGIDKFHSLLASSLDLSHLSNVLITSIIRCVYKFCKTIYSAQFTERTTEQKYIAPEFNNTFFANVTGRVSRRALDMVREQLQRCEQRMRTNSLWPRCSNSFVTTMGLPCSHILCQHILQKQPLNMADVDGYWWLNKNKNVAENSYSIDYFKDLLDQKVQLVESRSTEEQRAIAHRLMELMLYCNDKSFDFRRFISVYKHLADLMVENVFDSTVTALNDLLEGKTPPDQSTKQSDFMHTLFGVGNSRAPRTDLTNLPEYFDGMVQPASQSSGENSFRIVFDSRST